MEQISKTVVEGFILSREKNMQRHCAIQSFLKEYMCVNIYVYIEYMYICMYIYMCVYIYIICVCVCMPIGYDMDNSTMAILHWKDQ